jgi:hypothetical protein
MSSKIADHGYVEVTMPFSLTMTRTGDQVRLQFTGDPAVPLRLGDSWASILGHDRWRSQWLRTPPRRVAVGPEVEPDTERRIGLDQIGCVERDGKVIAKRVQTKTGTALMCVKHPYAAPTVAWT